MTTPTFANSGSIQPAQGREVAICSIAGGPFAAIDAYVSGGTPGVQLEMRLYAMVGTLRARVASALYAGPPVGSSGLGSLLEWVVINDPNADSPVVAGGTQYDLVAFGVTGAGTPIAATLAGTNAFDVAVNASATVALPSNYGTTTIATNVGCAQLGDVGVDQSGLPPNVAFDVLASCGAGSVEACVATGTTGGTDGLAAVIRDAKLPVATQYRAVVRETQGLPLSGTVKASLATYTAVIPNSNGSIILNGDVIGPSNNDVIISAVGNVTLEKFGGTGGGGGDAAAYTQAIASGKSIWIGAKTYLVSGYAGNFTTNEQAIFGTGNQSILRDIGDAYVMGLIGDDVAIHDLQILGDGSGATQGINGANASHSRVAGVLVKTVGGDGIFFAGNTFAEQGPQIYGTRAFNVGGNGLFLRGVEYATVTNHQSFGATGRGLSFDGGNNTVIGATSVRCSVGMYVAGTFNANDGHMVLVGLTANHASAETLHVEPLAKGLSIDHSHFYGFAAPVYVKGLGGGLASLVRFKDCEFAVNQLTFDTNALCEFDGNIFTADGVPGTNNAFVLDATAKVIIRPNNMQLDGTAFDTGLDAQWDVANGRRLLIKWSAAGVATARSGWEGTHGTFFAGDGTIDSQAAIGPLIGSEGTFAAGWFLSPGTPRSAANWGIAGGGGGADTYLNAVTTLHFNINGNPTATQTISTFTHLTAIVENQRDTSGADAGQVSDVEVRFTATGTYALPDPTLSTGRVLWVTTGYAAGAGNAVTLVRHGAETINGVGANLDLITPFHNYRITCNGTNWVVS